MYNKSQEARDPAKFHGQIDGYEGDPDKEVDIELKHGISLEEAYGAILDALDNDRIDGRRSKGGEIRGTAVGQARGSARPALVVFTMRRGTIARIITAGRLR